jgi:DNA-binding transcriptional regulator YhcF (GntR family)
MAKKMNSKGRSNKETFVMLRHDIYKSLAWKSLDTVARCVWLEIMYRYNGINNGEISLSCSEAAALTNVSKNTASLAFNRLIEAGFIRIALNSCFNMKQRRARRWRLTQVACQKNPASKEWKAYSAKLEKEKHGLTTVTKQYHIEDDHYLDNSDSPIQDTNDGYFDK